MRAVATVARASGGSAMPLAELAASEGIPQRFLEQIVLLLRRGGILESRRGSAGGYFLAKPVAKISLADILELVDGPLRLMEPGAEATASGSTLSAIFEEIEEDIAGRLAAITIEEVIARHAQSEGGMAYEI